MGTKGKKIIVAVLISIGIALILVGLKRGNDPVHDGKHLSEWLIALAAEPPSLASSNSAAQRAIIALGTNSLPYLVKAVTREPQRSKLVIGVRWLLDKAPVLRQIRPLRTFALGTDEDFKAYGATKAFAILRSAAEPSIPALVRAANDTTNDWTLFTVTGVLADIGPVGHPALVGIIQTNKNRTARALAIRRLALKDDNDAAVPMLIERLTNSDPAIISAAGFALSRIGARPAVVVPLLAKQFENPTSERLALRANMLTYLGRFGTNACESESLILTNLAREPDFYIVSQSLKTLTLISREPDRVLPVVSGYLRSTNEIVRSGAADALSVLGARATAALPDLTNALQFAERRHKVEKAISEITFAARTNAPAP